MLSELQALRNKQKKHDEELENLKQAQLQATIEVKALGDRDDDNDSRASGGRNKTSAIEEFTVSELLAQLQKQGKRVRLVEADSEVEISHQA